MDKKKIKFELTYSDFAMYDAIMKLGIATFVGDMPNAMIITAAIDNMDNAKLGPFVKNVVNELRIRFDEVASDIFKEEKEQGAEVKTEPFFGLGSQKPTSLS